MSSVPTVGIIFTGGTISMKVDPATGGATPMLSGEEIRAMVPELATIANTFVYDFGQYPGPQMTPALMLDLRNCVRKLINERHPDGIVITHGTDTLEETAYFLDVTLDIPQPVVFTGAMNNASIPDWDGPKNLFDAVSVAADSRFQNLGVLVCLAGEINAASEVSKTHTSEPGTFHSFNFGPLISIVHGSSNPPRAPHHRDIIALDDAALMNADIPIIKCYTGMSSRMIDHAVEDGVRGMVIEAMGVGNVPPAAFDGIARAIERGVIVVLVSRCPIGTPEDVYSYYGAGKNLKRIGVIFADYLNGQKARIKLLAALAKTGDAKTGVYEGIRALFEWVHGKRY